MFLRFYLLESVFLCIFSAVIFIFRWINSSILFTDCCMFVRNMLFGVTLFHVFSGSCISWLYTSLNFSLFPIYHTCDIELYQVVAYIPL